MIKELKKQIKDLEYECANPRNDGYAKELYEQKLKKLKKKLKEIIALGN